MFDMIEHQFKGGKNNHLFSSGFRYFVVSCELFLRGRLKENLANILVSGEFFVTLASFLMLYTN